MADSSKDKSDQSDAENVAAMVGRVLPGGDSAFQRLGMTLLEIKPGYAAVSMEVTADKLNAANMAVFALDGTLHADTAALLNTTHTAYNTTKHCDDVKSPIPQHNKI